MRSFNPPLQVVGFLATHRGEEERGPMVRLRTDEARLRMVMEGELVWVEGPRRKELALIAIDDSVPRGGVVVRDLPGVAVSEVVRLVKPDFDRERDRRTFA